MEFKELRKSTGLTQKAFSEKFNIPKRTIESWEEGARKPPQYAFDLLKYRIENEKKEGSE